MGQHTAECPVLDRQRLHARLLEPQPRTVPPGAVDHARGEVEPKSLQAEFVQHGRQVPGAASDVGDPHVPRTAHQLGEGADHVPRERPRLQPVGELRRVQLGESVVRRPGLGLVPGVPLALRVFRAFWALRVFWVFLVIRHGRGRYTRAPPNASDTAGSACVAAGDRPASAPRIAGAEPEGWDAT